MQETINEQCDEVRYIKNETMEEQGAEMGYVMEETKEEQFVLFVKSCAVTAIFFGAIVFFILTLT